MKVLLVQQPNSEALDNMARGQQVVGLLTLEQF